jgi:hypothetical protein
MNTPGCLMQPDAVCNLLQTAQEAPSCCCGQCMLFGQSTYCVHSVHVSCVLGRCSYAHSHALPMASVCACVKQVGKGALFAYAVCCRGAGTNRPCLHSCCCCCCSAAGAPHTCNGRQLSPGLPHLPHINQVVLRAIATYGITGCCCCMCPTCRCCALQMLGAAAASSKQHHCCLLDCSAVQSYSCVLCLALASN